MRAALFRSFGDPLVVEEVPSPELPDHGVIIQVQANGVCRSDWHAWVGHDSTVSLPHVPGHEMAGVVAEVGPDVEQWRAGDRVTVPFSCGCGTCERCDEGDTNLCDREYQPGFSGWGSFADYVAIPWADTNLVALPEHLDSVAAAALGCRFATAYQGLMVRAGLKPEEWVVVFGSGGVGMASIQIAAAAGAKVVAVDIDDAKLELARALGASAVVNASRDRPVQQVRAVTEGGAHVGVDALGSEETAQNSIRSLRKRGRHIQIGLVIGEGRNLPIPMSRVVSLELDVIGVHGMAAGRYREMFEFVEASGIDLDRLVGDRIPLDQAGAALSAMSSFSSVGTIVIEL